MTAGGAQNYPTTEERVYRKWLDMNYPHLYNRIARIKKERRPMTWFEATAIADSDILKDWDASKGKALKKFGRQIYNRT